MRLNIKTIRLLIVGIVKIRVAPTLVKTEEIIIQIIF